jgi:hypothetical protein
MVKRDIVGSAHRHTSRRVALGLRWEEGQSEISARIALAKREGGGETCRKNRGEAISS